MLMWRLFIFIYFIIALRFKCIIVNYQGTTQYNSHIHKKYCKLCVTEHEIISYTLKRNL